MPSSSHQALALQWAKTDVWALPLVSIIELAILVAGLAHGVAGIAAVAGAALVVSLNFLAASLAALNPRRYASRWRLPLVIIVRCADMLLFPTAIDLLSVMAGQPVSAAGGAAAVAAAAAAGKPVAASHLAAAALYARGAAFFVVPVAGVHACLLMALYCQLPPLAHMIMQLASVALLMHRTPAVCSQYVAMHPAHARLSEGAYWVVRHLVALFSSGTWLTLEAAAEEANSVQKCASVAWMLEIGFGLLLATLLTWRQQLHEAYELAVRKAQRSDEEAIEAREELLSSPYVRVCEPALRLANVYGTWAVPVAFAALFAFIAALVAQPGAA
ncbi:Transcriptional activator of maltose [Chlorella sorokiniana]|uniref:Transcriptional activator of maltose n=1 Tax=Chlorella sorokiniana TaxID=3076 RepID=A0A2P6TC23_CHLSO|nr:Transcriptional activator of maltose [Chlorella sorokiniana]|eukprot:PRW20181.1 Transcriptional activator of maltose [Chlorella sorokiniana]